jgi:hypothetical protein
MSLYALVLSSALVAAGLDRTTLPPASHGSDRSIENDTATPDAFWPASEQGAGPDLVGGLAGSGLVLLVGGGLWFFDPVNSTKSSRPRPVRSRRRADKSRDHVHGRWPETSPAIDGEGR